MLIIETYLKTPDGGVRIEDYTGTVPDPMYVEGWLNLGTARKELMGERMWDLVDQLWSYFADGVEEILAGRDWQTFFPDQPVKVTFTNNRDKSVTLTVDGSQLRSATVRRADFLYAIGSAGADAMMRFAEINPRHADSYLAVSERFERVAAIAYEPWA